MADANIKWAWVCQQCGNFNPSDMACVRCMVLSQNPLHPVYDDEAPRPRSRTRSVGYSAPCTRQSSLPFPPDRPCQNPRRWEPIIASGAKPKRRGSPWRASKRSRTHLRTAERSSEDEPQATYDECHDSHASHESHTSDGVNTSQPITAQKHPRGLKNKKLSEVSQSARLRNHSTRIMRFCEHHNVEPRVALHPGKHSWPRCRDSHVNLDSSQGT